MSRFEELEVWKRSARLSAELYKALSGLTDYGFRDQITRAGLSIPSNIAEGYERGSDREIANFMNYAKGSAGELRTQIYIRAPRKALVSSLPRRREPSQIKQLDTRLRGYDGFSWCPSVWRSATFSVSKDNIGSPKPRKSQKCCTA